MHLFINRKGIAGVVIIAALLASFLLGNMDAERGNSQASKTSAPWSYADFARSVATHHKAPFLSKLSASKQRFQSAGQSSRQNVHVASRASATDTNHKVNQDTNPWPKAGVAAAVNPSNGHNYVVMSNDYRQFLSHEYYHATTNGGQNWSDDALTASLNPATTTPYSYQLNPGLAFDLAGNSYSSSLSGNLVNDTTSNYANFDTEIDLVQGYTNGTYSSNISTPIDYVPCNGAPNTPGAFSCPGQLDKPFVTVDTNPRSPTRGSIYVYYTYFCIGGGQISSSTSSQQKAAARPASGGGGGGGGGGNANDCFDGNLSIPSYTSVILESHATGPGLPFTAPALVSGPMQQTEFSSMVIDTQGTPHIFFDDFSTSPAINMYESTLSGGVWNVASIAIANFQFNGLNNANWNFYSFGTVAPGCTIHLNTAYCAFAASQIGDGGISGTPDIYLASINTIKGGLSQISRVNNDLTNNNKFHFFPWATSTSTGDIYVGWYDSRADPFNTKVAYFVGKSSDGGKTFPKQHAVSDTNFNPCNGFPGCQYFGDYYQLVTGPDDVIHATWADSRDASSLQLYTQSITW